MPRGILSRRSDTGQISWGNLSRLPRTVAESTLRIFDGYGLRGKSPARLTLAPCIRFLSINSRVCSMLPSDTASRRWPLHFASPSPPSGWAEDFHLQAAEHAQHTTSPLRGSKSREAGSRSRGQGWRGGKVNTISSCIVGVQRMIKNSKDHLAGRHPDAASHIDPAITQ